MKIFKYKIPVVSGVSTITLPIDAKVLSCSIVNFETVIYALVSPMVKGISIVKILTLMTGEECQVPEDMAFLGTLQQNGIVVHVFVDSEFKY